MTNVRPLRYERGMPCPLDFHGLALVVPFGGYVYAMLFRGWLSGSITFWDDARPVLLLRREPVYLNALWWWMRP